MIRKATDIFSEWASIGKDEGDAKESLECSQKNVSNT